MDSSEKVMIELRDITLSAGDRTLLADVSVSLERGRLCALVGRNGAGKSTLLRCLCGLNKPASGQICIDGNPIGEMSPRQMAMTVAYVNTERIRVASLTCRDVVAMGRAPYTNWIGRMQPADRQAVDDALATVGMSRFAGRTLSIMSDGECQRVMIARAIAQDTPVILLDEPTSFLDMPGRYELAGLLRQLTVESGKTILFSTHELDIASRMTDDMWIIDSPDIISLPSPDFVARGYAEKIFGITL